MDGVIQLHGIKIFGKRPLLKQLMSKLCLQQSRISERMVAGKSVLFKLISILYRPDEGSIIVNGERIGISSIFHPIWAFSSTPQLYSDVLRT